jgi:nucleotide-binding universal stress UspA family protein
MITLRHILAATDFSDYSKEAVEYAVHLSSSLGADLHLLHVFEPPFFSHAGVAPSRQPEVHQWIRELKEEERKKLSALAGGVRGLKAAAHPVFKEGTPFLEILKAAGEIPADLIVLGTHGRTGLSHVLLGSVAERVVRQASCPVLTVKPRTLAAEQKKG